MDPAAALKAFAAVFPAELPDKTMVATIVLVTRYHRPLAVWCGAALAFALHVTLAVVAGSLLTLLPEDVVTVATAGLFLTGAVLLWRSAGAAPGEAASETDVATGPAPGSTARQAMAGSFALIAVAEWGDLTQLATAGLAGSTGSPLMVAAGALAALWAVSGLAATAGRGLIKVLPLDRLQRAAAGVFALLALLTLTSLL